MIARFHERYPGAYRHETYPTRDKVIPAGLFEMMAVMMDPLEAAGQFRATNAATLGQALLEASEKDRSKVKRQWGALERLAHPKILIEAAAPPHVAEAPSDLEIEKTPDGSATADGE